MTRNNPAITDPGEALAALGVLNYIEDLFTSTPKELFSPAEILLILNAVKNDPEIFDPLAVIAYEQVTEEHEGCGGGK